MSLDNEIYRALAEQTADHILVTDIDGTILYVNPAFEQLTGYCKEEVLGQNPRIMKSGLHDAEFYKEMWQTILSGQIFRGMTVNRKKDGAFYYEEKTITPVKDTNGQITHLISTGKDVTERVEAEQVLAKSEAYNRQILENMLDAVISMDEDGRIIGWNAEAERIFGWSADAIIGRMMPEVILAKPYSQHCAETLKEYKQTGSASFDKQRQEIMGWHAAGYEFPLELSVISSQQDGKIFLQAFARDITARKKAEEETQQYQATLESKADSLTTINTIANSLHRSPDFQTFVERSTEAIVQHTQAPSVALFILDPQTDRLELMASHGFSRETLEVGSSLPVKGSLSGITITQKQVVTSEGIVTDERLEPAVRQALLAQGLHNVVSFPLMFQDQVLGVVNLIYDKLREFSEQEKETLLMIGKTIGLAYINAQRLEDILRNEAHTQWRLEIRQALIGTESQADVFDVIVEKANYFPEASISLFVLNDLEDTAVLELKKSDSANSGIGRVPLGTQIPQPHLPTTFKSDQPFVSADITTDERVSPGALALATQFGAVSLALLPLRAGGDWLGFIVFASSEKGYFTEDKVLIYKDVAEQGALALRAAMLNERALANLVRREREVKLTTQVAQEIAAATNLHDLYQRVVTQVQEQFGYYYTQLLRYDDSMDTLALVVGYGEVGGKMLEMNHSMPMGVGLIGQAAQMKESVLRGNVVEDPNWQSNPLLPDTRSEMSVPIKLREKVLGVLDVQSNKLEGINTNDQLLLEGLCGQIAIAIESTELRQDMEGRFLELSLLQRQMSREGWQKYQRSRQNKMGYSFDLAGLQALTTQTDGAISNGKNGTTPQLPARLQVSNQLTIRGESIGTFGVEEDPERPLTDEEREIIHAVAEDLAEALEAARLFEQTQMALAEQERLSSELETVAQVSTAASTILEVDELLQSVVDLAKSSFDLYHAHIYLANETGKMMVLKAGAGNIGRLMSLEGREISIDDDSIVARAARSRKGVLENNVRRTMDFLPHPLLSETRAEMALPMVVGGKLIGVLDLQSDHEEFFSEEDLKVQTTLAAQIAVAVENANQYAAQVQTSTKLREVDQLKSEFLASMSHELRTPLNSIIGFADVLLEGLDGDLNDRMEEDVRLIRESGDHLRGLIGDILDMSKIEAGRMDLRYEQVDMAQLANDVMATAASLAQEKHLFLHLDIDENVQPVEADRTRLRQILWNIVGNAIKFTEKGSITISLQAQTNHVLCSIRDTGIGIKEENAATVFEQFRQIDGGLNRIAGGTGLGMPITKKLVELHGGEIWIESVYGQGSTFLFTIPYQPPKMKSMLVETVASAS